jgi:acyl dehydratase
MNEKSDSRQTFYLDDLKVGQRFKSGTYRMEEARMKEFAAEFDPQPFHLDHAAGEKSIFGGLAASGWHTAAVTMRLSVTGGVRFGSGSVGLGGEISWPRPTRPGDTLHVETEILEVIPSRSKPNQGVVKMRTVTLNQNGEEVQVFIVKIIVFKRPA